jgi:hypothetical protein
MSANPHADGGRTPGVRQPPPVRVAGQAAEETAESWERLSRPAPAGPAFAPSMVDRLPEPARRWLTHAIEPGTPLHRAAVLEMEGRIRLGGWLPLRAVQVHAPPDGYVWAARVRAGPLSISGYDRYDRTAGEMRWRLLGRLPLLTADGQDLDRSAAGRVALDAVFVPTAWLGPQVAWRDAGTDDSAIGEWTVDGHVGRCRITVDSQGALVSATMPRWARPRGLPWGEYPCGGILSDERHFDGIRIPTTMRVGYFPGEERWSKGEFLRATITAATFL